MGWMGFGNFNDAGNLFVVNSPIPGCLLLNKKKGGRTYRSLQRVITGLSIILIAFIASP